jgi:hypothetical protein
MSYTVNNGFYLLPPEERAAAYEKACRKYGVDNFFDLSPEERGAAYEEATRYEEDGG